ncbi:hypothetical protein E5S69_11585 [Cupriavidus necator]|uniref:hypothetical protein n=1 Tax=Cupriavidus necator TaxID=106590 RepID=UPI00148F46A1|nr:hypothetical protein [Cupriavidus necator]NOV24153.1 hypothetical protein [Cupriavidus necator]
MTVTTTTSQAPYVGDGTTVAFPFPYYFLLGTDIEVYVNGAIVPTGYTVTGAGVESGGTVTFSVAPSIGAQIVLLRSPDTLQTTDLPPNDPFPSEAVERALDKLTMLCQNFSARLGKALILPLYENVSGALANAATRAMKALAFDVNGNVTYLPIPPTVGAGNLTDELGIGGTPGFKAGVDYTAGISTTLTLSQDYGSRSNILVFFDGTFQAPDQYTLNGTTLTFNAPIPAGPSAVYVRGGTTLSLTIPADGTVGDDQLAWGNSLTRVVTTLTALKALDTSKYLNVYMLGRSTPGDGAQGEWRFDPSSVATPNDGTVVQPNTGTGRWLRQFSGDTLKACWFGAGMGAADDTAAITAALAATPTGGTLDFEGRQYNLIPSTNVAYKDKFNVTRKTAVQITGRSKLALLFREGSKIVVNGTDAERVAFFLKSCSGITIAAPNFPNVSGNTSIAGGTYLDSENYFPFAFEGNDGIYIHRPNFEACRSALMADAFNGLQNKNIVVDRQRSYQICNYSIIVRNGDNIQMLNARLEQTGRSWNTSNEDVAFSDNSTNCKAVNCDAINPIGRVSRFTSVNNAGPTVFENNRLNGGGICYEINQGSKVQMIGGYSNNQVERVSSHILFTSDLFYGNDNCSVVGMHFYGGGPVISDYYVSGWSGADIPGLVFKDCVAVDAYGPQMATTRVGVVFEGNRFDLNDSGILVRPGGKGTVFANNTVKNGYVRVDGDNFKATGNDMTGKVGAPIAFAWDVQGCIGFVERDNTYTANSYTQFYNHAPGARFGARYLEVGINANPQFSLASFVTGVLGDFFKNDAPVDGSPEGWVCTSAGSPGVWKERGQNGFRSTLGAPTVNAIYVGEELLDSTNNRWYKSKNTGTGASDWVALN